MCIRDSYKYCKYHGKCNHTTEQCKDIKRLITDDKRRKRKGRYNEKRDRDREHKKRRSSNYVKKSEINVLATKKLKKYLKKKKGEKQMQELRNFENIKLSDDEKSDKSSSSKSSKSSIKASDLDDVSDWSSVGSFSSSEWKIGSDENFVVHDIRRNSKKIKLENEVFTCLDDCINNNFNYESIRSRLASQSKK